MANYVANMIFNLYQLEKIFTKPSILEQIRLFMYQYNVDCRHLMIEKIIENLKSKII
jgi:hypothetical protein